MTHPLDRSIWHALSGPHARYAHGSAAALRYDPAYAPFAATRDDTPGSLAALHPIVPPGGAVALFTRDELAFPGSLTVRRRAAVTQMLLPRGALPAGIPALPATARPLGPDDRPAMAALVALTEPGPFAARTPEMGRYLGVFTDGALVAMAGERMCLDGFVEISAVCTHPDHRGKRLAAGLIASLARAAFDRGETPYLHAFADNAPAIAVYRTLGFAIRAPLHLAVVGRTGD